MEELQCAIYVSVTSVLANKLLPTIAMKNYLRKTDMSEESINRFMFILSQQSFERQMFLFGPYWQYAMCNFLCKPVFGDDTSNCDAENKVVEDTYINVNDTYRDPTFDDVHSAVENLILKHRDTYAFLRVFGDKEFKKHVTIKDRK